MILDDIIANTRAEIRQRKLQVPLGDMRARAEGSTRATLDFAGALKRDNIALIAEIKRASPSRGILRAELEPSWHARLYVAAGTAAISVLTDANFFHGSLADLEAVKGAVEVPVLRKDFIVDEYQVFESRAARADAILLIVRALADSQLRDYLELSRSLNLSALVEVHDEAELDRALAADASIIGINNRNLQDFTVSMATTERLAPRVPSGRLVVAESGVLTRLDVERVAQAGVHAVLVGEALMKAENVSGRVQELGSVRRP
jgi:indole-3-glycerol phosphate synthase